PASITPALTNSSLNFPISAKSFSLGMTPASLFLVALTITMNRIVVSCEVSVSTSLASRQACWEACSSSGRIRRRQIDNRRPSLSNRLTLTAIAPPSKTQALYQDRPPACFHVQPPLPLAVSQLPHGTHFDAAHAGGRDFRCELNRLVQIPRVDQVKTGKLFLGLGKRAVCHRRLPVADAHGGRRMNRLQSFCGNGMADSTKRLAEGHSILVR